MRTTNSRSLSRRYLFPSSPCQQVSAPVFTARKGAFFSCAAFLSSFSVSSVRFSLGPNAATRSRWGEGGREGDDRAFIVAWTRHLSSTRECHLSFPFALRTGPLCPHGRALLPGHRHSTYAYLCSCVQKGASYSGCYGFGVTSSSFHPLSSLSLALATERKVYTRLAHVVIAFLFSGFFHEQRRFTFVFLSPLSLSFLQDVLFLCDASSCGSTRFLFFFRLPLHSLLQIFLRFRCSTMPVSALSNFLLEGTVSSCLWRPSVRCVYIRVGLCA